MNFKAAIRKMIFILLSIFIFIAVFGLTIGQKISYEFSDYNISRKFYEIVFYGLPLSILLTLIATLERDNALIKNISIIALTIVVAIYSVIYQLWNLFTIGFGDWSDMLTIYESKDNSKIRIVKQEYDVGALGYGGERIVKLTPYLGLFSKVEIIDTSQIDKSKWILVNKEGNVHFP